MFVHIQIVVDEYLKAYQDSWLVYLSLVSLMHLCLTEGSYFTKESMPTTTTFSYHVAATI